MTEKHISVEDQSPNASEVPVRVTQRGKVAGFIAGTVLAGGAIVSGGHALEAGANFVEDHFYDGNAGNHAPEVPGPQHQE